MPKTIDHADLRRFVTERLYWFGSVSPKDLRTAFGIGPDLASRFLSGFRTTVPLQIEGKRYVLAPDAEAEVLLGRHVDAHQFLSLLDHTSLDAADRCALFFDGGMPMWNIDRLRREVRRDVLRALVQAIRQRLAIEVTYVGMDLGETAVKRTVEPVRLTHFDGRWHLDAHCYLTHARRDFVLSRITATGGTSDAVMGIAASDARGTGAVQRERAWFKPHPDLTRDQHAAVAFEFGMDDDGILRLDERSDSLSRFRQQFVASTPHELPPRKILVEIDPNQVKYRIHGFKETSS